MIYKKIILSITFMATLFVSCKTSDSDVLLERHRNIQSDRDQIHLITQIAQKNHENQIKELFKICDTLHEPEPCPEWHPRNIVKTILVLGQLKIFAVKNKLRQGNFLGVTEEEWHSISTNSQYPERKATVTELADRFESTLSIDFINLVISGIRGSVNPVSVITTNQSFNLLKALMDAVFVDLPDKIFKDYCSELSNGCEREHFIAFRYFVMSLNLFLANDLYGKFLYVSAKLGAFLPRLLTGTVELLHPRNLFVRFTRFIKNLIPGEDTSLELGKLDKDKFIESYFKMIKTYFHDSESYKVNLLDTKAGKKLEVELTAAALAKDSFKTFDDELIEVSIFTSDLYEELKCNDHHSTKCIGMSIHDDNEVHTLQIEISSDVYKIQKILREKYGSTDQLGTRSEFEHQFSLELKALASVVLEMM